MKLTRAIIERAKPKSTVYRLTDGGGPGLIVRTHGAKTWIFRFKQGGKDRNKTLGSYPEMSPEDARAAAAALKAEQKRGVDPSAKALIDLPGEGATFQMIAERYMKREEPHWSLGHISRFRHRMTRDVFPAIGDVPIGEVRPRDVMAAVGGIAGRGAQDTAVRVAGMIGQVCRYAVALDLRDYDPTIHLKSGLDRPPATIHRAALTEPAEVGQCPSSGFLGPIAA